MGESSHLHLRTLITLRCIGYSTTERVAAAAGIDVAAASRGLQDLADAGMAIHAGGVFGGWSLSDAGRTEVVMRVAEELEASGARSTIEDLYAAFGDLNPRLLSVCGEWQIRSVGGSTISNDHQDVEYDLGVIDRLARIDSRIQPIIAALTGALDRYSPYAGRLGTALARVDAGEHRYFTDDMESYHTIWFQLHEDLLLTLGRDRFAEG